jgi:plasmid stabilization system protein ParE
LAKKIIWTGRAKSDLNKVYEFNSQLFGEEKSFKIIENIVKKADLLYQPVVGSTRFISSLNPEIEYLKLVYNQILIVYRIHQDTAYVIRIFDSRQDPKDIEL